MSMNNDQMIHNGLPTLTLQHLREQNISPFQCILRYSMLTWHKLGFFFYNNLAKHKIHPSRPTSNDGFSVPPFKFMQHLSHA